MALEDSNVTPNADATPAQPAPEVAAPAPPSVDLSALSQPGSNSQPSITGTQEYRGMVDANAAAATAAKNAAELAKPTPPPAPVPHARLLAMVQGLSLGLSSAATSIATHGERGGAAEVIQVQQAQKEAQQQAAAAQQAAKNQQIQQQVTIGETNRQLAQSYLNLMTLPDEITKNHLVVSGEAQRQDITGAEFQASHGGMSPNEFSKALSSTAPVSLQSGASSFFTTSAQQQLGAATKTLGSNDPYVKALQTVLGDAKATPKDIWTATNQLQTQLGLQEKATEAQNKITAGLPKNQSEAASQLADAQNSGDPVRIARAQKVKDSIDTAVKDERQFAANLQQQNNVANKELAMSNALAQKGIEDTNKLWTDPQHGFAQTRSQVEATKNIVAQAKSGSELAASLEPAMTVLGVNSFAGVHRISPTEYEAAGPQVGSLYRRLNSLLDKAGKGSVPPATLSEVNGIMDALVRGKYQASLDSTRQIVSNAGLPEGRVFIPAPNNFGTLTTLDKVPSASAPAGPQSAIPAKGSPAAKLHANMGDFTHQFTGAKGTIYSDDGTTWFDASGQKVGK